MKPKLNIHHKIFFFIVNLALFTGIANPLKAEKTDSVVFVFKASEQSWTVPQGVTKIHVDARGAQGGSAKGGKGGRVVSDLSVSPGTKLIINVGSQPSDNQAGYNGGGKGCGNGFGGGGATDIRIGGSSLENRVLVAGGGGGNGYSGYGGAGGGLEGADGKYVGPPGEHPEYHDAKGGTQQAGGKGARAYFAKSGEAGTGGDGISGSGNCTNNAMGGGGGGYYGGGGSGGGGGGGGSSYTNSSNTHVTHEQGVNEGNGRLVIYFEKN
jgi:hypothetical protein